MNNNHNQKPPPQNKNGPPSMVRRNGQAPRTMEELCQPSINGRGGPVAPIPIQATDFGLRHHMIEQVENTCQFHGLPGDDANRHIDKFLEITQHMKQNEVSDDALRLSLFPYYLTHHAITLYDRLPRNSIYSFDDMMRKFLSKYFPPFVDTSAIRDETSRNISSTSTTESLEVVRQLEMMNKNFLEMMRQFQMVKIVDTKCETCGGPYSFTECPAVGGYIQETAYATTSNYNSREWCYFSWTSVSPPSSKVVDREQETITNQVLNGSTNNVPPLVVQPSPASTSSTPISSPKMPEVTKDTKLREKDDNLALKFVEIFRNLHFKLSLADALLHMPKFALMLKSSLNNKETLFYLATTLVNENCSAVILKKLPEKLGNPDKFLIPCDFPELDECLALEDLAITFKVGQTSKYSYNDAESINRIDVIDIACKEYVQEVLGFSDTFKSGNPTLISDPIIALSSSSLSSFEGGDFILEEIEACLTSKSIPSGIDDTNLYLEGDIRLLEELLNNDPSSSSLLPSKELNVEEIKTIKSSIDEPSELELKELPYHLEYAFLDGTDNPWVSPVYCVPKKGGMNVVENEDNELIPTRYFQILIDPQDQEKTTFTCPYGTFAYRRMPFGLCNALGTFQRCMMDIFHDMIEKTMEVFMDDFLVFGDSFSSYLSHLDKMLQRCEDTNPVLNWEKCHFMVKEGIVLGHKISKSGIKVDRAKVDVIAKLPHLTSVKVTENLATSHLSRLENPHQDELEKKEITETFPLENLGMIAFRGDSSTPWFADIANYHAGNFIVKGMSSQQKKC
nr:reverse transcriptase domain-containing protein [Tanacetum cinerariifolium]